MWVIYLLLGLAVLLAVALLVIWMIYKRDYWRFLSIPHEKPKRLLQIYREIRGASGGGDAEGLDVEYLGEIYKRHKGSGPFCGFYRWLRPTVLVLDRELVKQILFKDFSNFNDRGNYYNRTHDPLSGHLFNLGEDTWKEMRPRVEATFGEDKLRRIFDSLAAHSLQLPRLLEAAVTSSPSASLSVKPLLQRHICDSIASCVFGLEQIGHDSAPFDEFFAMTQAALRDRRHGVIVEGLLYWHPSVGRTLGFATTARPVHAYFAGLVRDVVNARELKKVDADHKDLDHKEHTDFLQLLIEMQQTHYRSIESDDKDSKGGVERLRQQLLLELAAHAFGFLHTAYESTSRTLAHALRELALNQELQERVREEVQTAMQKHEQRLDYDCVQGLELMGQVIAETIRMHPVVPFLTRRTLHDYRVSGHSKYLLARNMYVVIPVHAMHNDPDLFPEPMFFRPERFSAQARRERDSCTWLGFGEGPRNCVGMRFAQIQMRLILARLLLSVRFEINVSRPAKSTWEEGVELTVRRV